ncbi:MAG: DNA polymerase I [Oscillospiraceae bacterium]|nr:DNA polymerase I [Oscillospiraceae bacterium]
MKLLAIDGNSILNRAFYGIKLLSNKKGQFTNAITGFMNIYLKEKDIVKPDCTVVAFDMRKPTFRHEAVATYKANRKGMPEELASQLPLIKQLLTDLGIGIIECEGYEADDILGTLARICAESLDECVLLTGDRDSLQLIDKFVNVRFVATKETVLYDEKMFFEKYGFPPVNLIDLKALMGDSSDNISGVAGIGEKTATTLIKEFGTVERLYNELTEASVTKSVYNKLTAGKEAANQSKWLATICKTAPIDNDICSYGSQPDKSAAASLLNDLEMFKLMDRLGLRDYCNTDESGSTADSSDVTGQKVQIKDIDVIDDSNRYLIINAQSADYLFDAAGCSVLISADDKYYTSTDKNTILEFLASDIKKRTFAAKLHYHFAFENASDLRKLKFDAEMAAYLINPLSSEYTIADLCRQYNIECTDGKEIFSIKPLFDKLESEIERLKLGSLLMDIEQPLTEVLASMEHTGVRVDTDGVKFFGEKLSEDIGSCKNEIFRMAGREFNISSPKQLGEILFNDLGLPAKKKTKTGYSTNAEVLEELRTKHPIIDFILQYRQLTKLQSTYVDGLLKTVSSDGRVHTVFKQTETRTGRISSTEPNLQNIPVRTERGREMRKFFTAAPGKILLDADYSQIELRIMAHICGDPNMQQAFIDNTDIHTITASQVFNMPPEMVTPSMRSAAKAVNFGIIYGIGAFSLSKDINVSVAQADNYIKSYLENFPGVKTFMTDIVESAKENGYVTTMFGRRRDIPELKSSNKILQAQGKRIAMNTPIQGTAADIIKIAMIRVYNRLEQENIRAKLILQVHDELIVEADECDAGKAAVILSEEMTNAVSLSVPLTADVNKGETWYEAKG